jgi:hypothetical protein
VVEPPVALDALLSVLAEALLSVLAEALLSPVVAGALALVFVVVVGAPQLANTPRTTARMNNRLNGFIE